MLQKITGPCFRNMVKYGLSNLEKYCELVNDLNVFPVPDGDTGTNMVMTIKNALPALDTASDALSKVAQSFASATVFGARGNSGVIVSQFFKGLADGFTMEDADPVEFSRAIDNGYQYAYAAVAKPVEGTILTVIKDGAAAIKDKLSQITAIDEAVSAFISQAKISLENTPNLLPILKKAGVIDSGGAGLVYFFEGIALFLNGEPLPSTQYAPTENAHYVDYSAFNRYSNFEYGYCTEAILQLTVDEAEFRYDDFCRRLQKLGDSIVTSYESDKIKLHIHSHTPEKVLAFCHRYGEFLALKIENMSVQHTQTTQKKYLCSKNQEDGVFALVAVAPNGLLQAMLSDMGADVVILSAEAPSSQDFIEAFEHLSAKEILVFPNSSNSIMSAEQAGNLYDKAHVTVINCRSIAECYSAMAVIEFGESDVQAVVDIVNETISNIYQVAITRATKNTRFGAQNIVKDEYFSLAGKDVLMTGSSFETVSLDTVKIVAQDKDCSVINLFYGKNISESRAEKLAEQIRDVCDAEVCLIATQDDIYDLIASFE
ncbi:MAG: DAK2 domain-containing protein [Clostridiales bacterium]|nr:DAK2 domain-containing protein [Clostridiales bacterium]